MSVDATHRSIRELEVELKLALGAYDRADKLHQNASISSEDWEKAKGKVLLIAARLDGLYDELVDQNDRFRLEFKRKRAELAQAEAQREVPASVVARNQRLNQRKAGTVSDEDLAKAHGELKSAEALVEIKNVEIQELELRREQSRRQGERIRQVIAMAGRVKAGGVAAPTAPPTVPADR